MFDTKRVKVYAGSGQQKCSPPPGAVVFDLANYYVRVVEGYGIRLPRRFERGSKIIKLNWPDFSIPSLNAEDWQALVRCAVKFHKPLFIACQGGHGRTGTALAIVAHLIGVLPPKSDPVAMVRKAYCKDAVESDDQVEYIEAITGRKSKCVGSMGGFGGEWGWWEKKWEKKYTTAEKEWSFGDEVIKEDKCEAWECKWRPAHTGCLKYGHEPGEPLRKDY